MTSLTLQEVREYLANGWFRVPGRTERQLMEQMHELLAASGVAAPAMLTEENDDAELFAFLEPLADQGIEMNGIDAQDLIVRLFPHRFPGVYPTPSQPVAAEATAEVTPEPRGLANFEELPEQVQRVARAYHLLRDGYCYCQPDVVGRLREQLKRECAALAAPVEVQGAPYTDGAFLVPGVPLPALPCTEFRLWYPGNTTGCAGYTAQAMAAHAAHYGQAVAKALAGRPAPAATWECPECHTGGCEVGKCHIGAKPPAPAVEAEPVATLRRRCFDGVHTYNLSPISRDDGPAPWEALPVGDYQLFTRPAAPLSEVEAECDAASLARSVQRSHGGWEPPTPADYVRAGWNAALRPTPSNERG